MSNLFNIRNPSNGYMEQITLMSEFKASKYKLSYECNSIGTGSFIVLYGINSVNEYTTYFLPVQFTGHVEFNLQLNDDTTTLQIEFHGDASISDFIIVTADDPYIEYVKSESKYWDRIKEVTNSTGKLKAEAMEGILNMTLNAFANESGTITQENGVMTFLNGTTVENSTQAVQIAGGAIRIASSKDADGNWVWATALTGGGINADTITAGVLRAIELSGVNMTTSTFTAGNIIGASMEGGSASFGDKEVGTYMEITSGGDIVGYARGKKTILIRKASEGRLTLGLDLDEYSAPTVSLHPISGLYGTSNTSPAEGATLSSSGSEGIEISGGGAHIVLYNGGVNIYTQNRNGTVYVEGNLYVTGSVRAQGGVN